MEDETPSQTSEEDVDKEPQPEKEDIVLVDAKQRVGNKDQEVGYWRKYLYK